jgi:hypothetical protein
MPESRVPVTVERDPAGEYDTITVAPAEMARVLREGEARERLNAAAPDLLAACREAYGRMTLASDDDDLDAMLGAAIAKAEGG